MIWGVSSSPWGYPNMDGEFFMGLHEIFWLSHPSENKMTSSVGMFRNPMKKIAPKLSQVVSKSEHTGVSINGGTPIAGWFRSKPQL